MDTGIWATWYDLDESGRPQHLDWLHNRYLPQILTRPGVAWAAHYEIRGGGAKMNEIHGRLVRADAEGLGQGSQYLVLVGAATPHLFVAPRVDEWEAGLTGEARTMLNQRIGQRVNIFSEEARVTGPEYATRAPGSTPGPAIQMGSFRTATVEDEWDLAAWYAQYRLPHMSAMPGCIATRKLLSVVGWAKHSILYEFTSLDARQAHFERHESLALNGREWTNKIITYTVHAPGSPSVAARIWPAVEPG